MTGSHEVRGSIPLDSTNKFNNLRQAARLPFLFRYQYVTKIRFRVQIFNRPPKCRIGRMRIAVRNANIRMPQDSCQRKGIGSGIRHSGCGSMPQIVKAEISDTSFRKCFAETSLDIGQLSTRFRTRKNVFAFSRQVFEKRPDGRIHRHDSFFIRFAFPNLNESAGKIHVKPLEIENLAPPQSRMKSDGHYLFDKFVVTQR